MNDGLNMTKYMAESESMMLEWIDAAPGEFSVQMMTRDPEYQYIYLYRLENLVKAGELERVGNKRGWYRRRQPGIGDLWQDNSLRPKLYTSLAGGWNVAS